MKEVAKKGKVQVGEHSVDIRKATPKPGPGIQGGGGRPGYGGMGFDAYGGYGDFYGGYGGYGYGKDVVSILAPFTVLHLPYSIHKGICCTVMQVYGYKYCTGGQGKW